MDDFRNALDTIPQSLEETYHQALTTIPEINRGRVRQILIWLTTSFRELRPYEVATVVDFPFFDDVLKLCTSVLVTIVDRDTFDTIKLAHLTVKEFLLVQAGCDEGLHWFRFTTQLAHRCIADQTLRLMFQYPGTFDREVFWKNAYKSTLVSNLSDGSSAWPRRPRNLRATEWAPEWGTEWATEEFVRTQGLRAYALDYWLIHARQNDATTDWGEVQANINSIFESDGNQYFRQWLAAQYPFRSMSDNALTNASLLGLKQSVVSFWQTARLEDQDRWLGDALKAAASMGHIHVIDWLIDQRDDVARFIDLPWVLECLRDNTRKTVRALFRKGPRTVLSADALISVLEHGAGVVVLAEMIDEDLISVLITDSLIRTLSQVPSYVMLLPALMGKLVPSQPISNYALVLVARASPLALRILLCQMQRAVYLQTHDWDWLAHGRQIQVLETLLSEGIYIPNTQLLNVLAALPYGSVDLRRLLSKGLLEQRPTAHNMYLIAKCFHLGILEMILEHKWVEDIVVEDFIQSVAFNCYLQPPQEECGHLSRGSPLVSRRNRTRLLRSDRTSRSRVLTRLVERLGSGFEFTESIVNLLVTEFNMQVLVRVWEEKDWFPEKLQAVLKAKLLSLPSSPQLKHAIQPRASMHSNNHRKFDAEDAEDALELPRGLMPDIFRSLKFSLLWRDRMDTVYVLPINTLGTRLATAPNKTRLRHRRPDLQSFPGSHQISSV